MFPSTNLLSTNSPASAGADDGGRPRTGGAHPSFRAVRVRPTKRPVPLMLAFHWRVPLSTCSKPLHTLDWLSRVKFRSMASGYRSRVCSVHHQGRKEHQSEVHVV